MRRDIHEKVLKQTGFSVLELKEFAVPDCFSAILDKNESIEKIINFQRGYWAQTVRDSLLENGVDPKLVAEVCQAAFDEEFPKYIREHIDGYPEAWGGLCYFVRNA